MTDVTPQLVVSRSLSRAIAREAIDRTLTESALAPHGRASPSWTRPVT